VERESVHTYVPGKEKLSSLKRKKGDVKRSDLLEAREKKKQYKVVIMGGERKNEKRR